MQCHLLPQGHSMTACSHLELCSTREAMGARRTPPEMGFLGIISPKEVSSGSSEQQCKEQSLLPSATMTTAECHRVTPAPEQGRDSWKEGCRSPVGQMEAKAALLEAGCQPEQMDTVHEGR